MGLNLIEHSDVSQFIETVEDEHIRNLLNRLLLEHSAYEKVGTVEECKRYKEWCDLSPSDYMRMFDNFAKFHRDEIAGYEKLLKNRKGKRNF